MSIRANEAYEHIQHALGGGELDPRIDQLGLINQAGEHLYSLHPWHFTKRRFALVDLRGQVNITNAIWSESNLTLTDTNAFANYTFVSGDFLRVDTGTNATSGYYTIASNPNSNDIVLEQSIGAAADGDTDIGGKVPTSSAALPQDFRSHIKSMRTDGSLYNVTDVSLQEILEARSLYIDVVGDWNYKVAFNYSGSPPVPLMELWPTPGTNAAGAFTVAYKKGWTRVATDNAILDFPEFMDALYLQIVRAMAKGYESDLEGGLSREDLLERIELGPEMRAAKQRDSGLQWNRGRLRGGGADVHRGRFNRGRIGTTPWRISGPS